MASQAFTALSDAQARLAQQGASHIGNLVTWNADRVDVPRAELRAMFATIGLANLVPDMSPDAALTRAAGEGTRPEGLMVRAFAKGTGAARTGASVGVYLIGANGERGDNFTCGARAKAIGDKVHPLAPEGSPSVDTCMEHAHVIARRANHLIDNAEARDLSGILVKAAQALGGVPLRDRGGYYLLPPTKCGLWSSVEPQLTSLGFEPLTIVMHDCPANVRAAAKAAVGSLESDIKGLEEDIAKIASDGMRTFAIERRVAVCDELAAKVDLYRGVLANAADRLQMRLASLQRVFVKSLASEGKPVPGLASTRADGAADDDPFAIKVAC